MGKVRSLSDHASYESFFVRPDEQPHEQRGAEFHAAEVGHICVDSRGLVGVPKFSVQTPGDARSIVIATHVALGGSRNHSQNRVAQAVVECIDWRGHDDCRFRVLMSDIISPVLGDDEAVRANSLKIGMGVLDDDLYEQLQDPLSKFSQPESVEWQAIEDPSSFAGLHGTESKTNLYIANGVKGEYFQACDAYEADCSAYVQTSGDGIVPLFEALRPTFPIEFAKFAGTLAMLGGSTAKALDAKIIVRETPFALAA